MMDTVLNTGLNETTAAALMRKTGNPRFVWDSYRRFVDMFGDVCCGVSHELFEAEMAELKAARGVKEDIELEAADLEELVTRYKKVFEANYGQPFPERPRDQLRKAILAVFSSWSNPRAVAYRRINKVGARAGVFARVVVVVMVWVRERKSSCESVCVCGSESAASSVREPDPVGTAPDHGPARHRRQRAVHGVRQHGRHQRHRRPLHAQPGDGGGHHLRRVPHQRSGRGRGGRHPHAQAHPHPRVRASLHTILR